MQLLEKRLARFGIKPGLERIRRLCGALGNPQERLRVILVTGTNGKGSVVSCLSSILREAGYKTGSYYSPHLVKYNERIRINGKGISDVRFKNYEKKILGLLARGYEMTLFEALTAVAYRYFADEDCDYAVMEIGMGGSFDATNIAKEDIAIITNVDLEHTAYLGDTVEEIAGDKAGIIKNGNGVAITACSGGALEAIKEKIKKENKGTRLKVLNENFFAKLKKAGANGTVFDYVGENFYLNLKTSLAGRYQASNAALAIAAAEELGVEEEAIRKGLVRAKNPGRMQVVSKGPLTVMDAAHNAAGIRELVANLDLFDYDRLICVFTAMKDKDWKGMISLLAPECDYFIANELEGNDRAEKAESLAEEAGRHTGAVAIKNVKKSVARARKIAGRKDLVLICGSIYMLGGAMEALKPQKIT